MFRAKRRNVRYYRQGIISNTYAKKCIKCIQKCVLSDLSKKGTKKVSLHFITGMHDDAPTVEVTQVAALIK